MSTEERDVATEFEQDVTAIVRKVVAKDYNSAMAGLEERLVEKLQDILKRKETEKVAKNSRMAIQTAPMVVIPEGFDPELAEIWAYTAAQEGKWVALVYSLMAEVPKISDALANGNDVRTVSRAYGQQSITFKNGGRILWLAKDLKGGRGVSVNLVLRVEGRGEGAKLCMANEEKLFARPTEEVSRTMTVSEQVERDVLGILSDRRAHALTAQEVVTRTQACGGVIWDRSVYYKALERLLEKGEVLRRFNSQWMYYRSA